MTGRPRPRITSGEPFSNVFAGLFGSGAPAPKLWTAHCPCNLWPGDLGWTAYANTLPAAYHRAIAHLEADHPVEDQ